MDRETATILVDQYFRECEDTLNLNDNQVLVLVGRLMKLSSATVNDVARIATQEFPREKPMALRPGYKKPQQQQAAQTREQMNEVIADFINTKWPLVAPLAIPPFGPNGQIVSKINSFTFTAAVNAQTVHGTGEQPVRADILCALVIKLDQDKLLEHYPQVVERVVEKEIVKTVPLTRKQEARHDFELDQRMNSSDSAIKGATDHVAKKPASQEEIAAVAHRDLDQNAIMGEINAKIAQHAHHGRSHSATTYERKVLENIRDTGIRAGLPNERINQQIDAKRSEMTRWSAQEALRQLRPELFTAQPKAAYR